MPPIPLHTNSPINAAKASSPPETTTSSSDNSPPPPATTTTAAAPTNTLPTGPPPPQPGAVPHLPSATSYNPGPAPPAPAITTAPSYPPPPNQTDKIPPQLPYNQRGTSTTFQPPPPTTTQPARLPVASPYESCYGGGGIGNVHHYPSSPDQKDEDEEGLLGSAMKFAKAAGTKLVEAESEVWKRINGQK
ncbi:hypothetical protein QBC38DRAFT_223829 [Podospora fimiseda]|uniref:Uncharacterized protein n=1 Tax=Podospora fimiseda TaxID=252190 RepID=A0AAN7H7S3_9PEZI|nr:hypothetical protein QBC38DRAFT_223829 [Podospora fimiseda]